MGANVTDTDEARWKCLRYGIYEWWTEREFQFPWRASHDEWKLLVTEMLLVRTPPERVSQYFEAFFEELESVSALSRATPEEIATTIAPLGLAKRATYLSKLGDQLAERNGNVPESREELEELSGVGPYVAGAFQVLHRDKETWFADSNVVRILARFFGFERGHGTYRRKWFLEFAQKLFDHPFPPSEFGYAVLDFGREVCSNSPRCNICPVNEACSYYSESQGAQSTTS